MRTLTTLLIGLLLVNCTTPVEPVYTYSISKELQPYVREVLTTLEFHNIEFKKQSFIVVFDADIIRTPLAGQAKGMDNDNLVYVLINPVIWGKLTVKERRHVIFHELAHAAEELLYNDQEPGQVAAQEIVAEFSAVVLMRLFGLQSGTRNTYDYIKSYAESNEKDIIKVVAPFISRIDKVVNKILETNEKVTGMKVGEE